MKILLINLCSLLLLTTASWAKTEAEIITEMAYCSDCRLDRDMLLGLSADSLSVLSEIIADEENVYVVGKSIFLLSEKYDQFSEKLPAESQDYFVETILNKVRENPEFYMDFNTTHESLIRFNHPLVLQFAKDQKDSDHDKTRMGAEKIIASFNASRSSENSTTPPTAEVEKEAQESTAPEPSTEKLAEVKTPDTTEEPAEQSSNWWLWLIGALVVVGGIALVVRRKS